jgi:hypothetical protein
MNKYGIGLGLLIILVSGACFSCGCVTQPAPEVVEVIEVVEVVEYVEVVEVVEVESEYEKAWKELEYTLSHYTQGVKYVINENDCSDMSKHAATLLTKMNSNYWNVEIGLISYNETNGHMWVIVDYQNDRHMDWIEIECTVDPLNCLGWIVPENTDYTYLPYYNEDTYEYGVYYRTSLEEVILWGNC